MLYTKEPVNFCATVCCDSLNERLLLTMSTKIHCEDHHTLLWCMKVSVQVGKLVIKVPISILNANILSKLYENLERYFH